MPSQVMKTRTSGPGWIPTIAALVALSLTLSAAYWQFGRARQKEALLQEYLSRQAMPALELGEPFPADNVISYRKVSINGRYLPAKAILLDNKIRNGVPGYEIVAPLQISGTNRTVLINRGWVEGSRDRSRLPAIDLPEGVVTVTGTAVLPGRGALELSEDVIDGPLWQNLNLERYRQRQRLDVANFVVQEESDRNDGISRVWAAPGFGIEMHRSYTGQWLLFSALIVFFYIYYGFFRRKPGHKK
ncbi:MAG: SURF1 family protein [Burkholderiales bacterium]